MGSINSGIEGGDIALNMLWCLDVLELLQWRVIIWVVRLKDHVEVCGESSGQWGHKRESPVYTIKMVVSAAK
jgi:hypothetical protein